MAIYLILWYCETEYFWQKRRFPLLCMKFFEVGFLKTEKGTSTNFSVTNDQCSSDRKTWYHPRRRKHSRYGKKFWNTEVFIYESFQYSEIITFIGKLWYPPPISRNFSDIRKFLKYRCVPRRPFSPKWDRKVPSESRKIPHQCRKLFDTVVLPKYWMAI